MLRIRWEKRIMDRWGESIHRETVGRDLRSPDRSEAQMRGDHAAVSDTKRQSATSTSRKSLPVADMVEDLALMPKLEVHPILFEQRYTSGDDEKENEAPKKSGHHGAI